MKNAASFNAIARNRFRLISLCATYVRARARAFPAIFPEFGNARNAARTQKISNVPANIRITGYGTKKMASKTARGVTRERKDAITKLSE